MQLSERHRAAWQEMLGSYNFPPPLGKLGRILPTFTTFPTLHFPAFGAAIIKSITFPAHVFLMATCPFKEHTQPWSQPWVERDLPNQNLCHFPTFPTEFPTLPTFPTEFPTFPTDLNAKILEFRAYRLWPTYAYGLTSVWRHFFMCWK
jgi:hypothetical protein